MLIILCSLIFKTGDAIEIIIGGCLQNKSLKSNFKQDQKLFEFFFHKVLTNVKKKKGIIRNATHTVTGRKLKITSRLLKRGLKN